MGVVCLIAMSAVAAGCSSRPYGTLIAGSTAPDAGQVDLLVATTRAPVLAPPGVMFGGSRGRGLDFADIVVSIPPASVRRPGDIPLPSFGPWNLSVGGYLTWWISHVHIYVGCVKPEYQWNELTDI